MVATRGARARPACLCHPDLQRLTELLLEGAAAHGFTGELWTVARITQLIGRQFGADYHPSHVWWLLRHRLGWSPQRPVRQAKERDQAAIDQWVSEDWPRIKQTPEGAEPAWCSSTSRA